VKFNALTIIEKEVFIILSLKYCVGRETIFEFEKVPSN
jgi:hypothetical protein